MFCGMLLLGWMAYMLGAVMLGWIGDVIGLLVGTGIGAVAASAAKTVSNHSRLIGRSENPEE
jgi:hypothetical protein